MLLGLLSFSNFSYSSTANIVNFKSVNFQVSQKTELVDLYKKSDSLFKLKEYPIALELALELLDRAKNANDGLMISEANYLIGNIWYKSRSYDKAIPYFKASLEDFLRIIEESDKYDTDLDPDLKSGLKILQNNFDLGKTYHRINEKIDDNDSLALLYQDSAKFYYNKVIENPSLKEDIRKLQSKVYNNLSGIYYRDSLFDKAEEYSRKSLDIKKLLGDQYSIAIGYNSLANIFISKEDYESAKTMLEEAIKFIDKIEGDKADKIRADLYRNLAFSLYLMKDYTTYEYLKESWSLSDMLKDKYNEQKLAETYGKFNVDVAKRVVRKEEEIKRQKAQKWFIGGGIGFLSVIIILGFFLKQNKLKRENLSLELSQQELIQQQKLEKIKAEAQIRILNATLDGKETERKQIAETLHDSVSALLSSANLHLQACKTQFNGSTPIEVDKSQSIINEASQKIRDLSHTLVSSILLKFGLSYAIKDITEKFSNSELTIDYETRYIQRYDQGFEIKLYNIIQEFINNILKHSQANYAKITLIQKKKKLHLVIEDNGQGFDKTKIPEKDGLGINQIDARIQMMQGKFDIESSFGQGTKITIELPIYERKLETIS